jgi:hypothetical protein
MVDHQDKLAGADSDPVINFGLNIWRVKGIIKTAADADDQDPGAELWYYDPGGAVDDTLATRALANLARLFAGKPTAANHAALTANTGTLYKIGTVMDKIAGGASGFDQDDTLTTELRVMIGGVAVCETSAVA